MYYIVGTTWYVAQCVFESILFDIIKHFNLHGKKLSMKTIFSQFFSLPFSQRFSIFFENIMSFPDIVIIHLMRWTAVPMMIQSYFGKRSNRFKFGMIPEWYEYQNTWNFHYTTEFGEQKCAYSRCCSRCFCFCCCCCSCCYRFIQLQFVMENHQVSIENVEIDLFRTDWKSHRCE